MADNTNFVTKAADLFGARVDVVAHVFDRYFTVALIVGVAVLWYTRGVDIVALLVEILSKSFGIVGATTHPVD